MNKVFANAVRVGVMGMAAGLLGGGALAQGQINVLCSVQAE